MNIWYKNQLSPFGQKVLQTLVEQYNTDRIRQSRSLTATPHRQKDVYNTKVLSFRDSNAYSTVNSGEQILQSGKSKITSPVLNIIEGETVNEIESNASHQNIGYDTNTTISRNIKESDKEDTIVLEDVYKVLSVPDTFHSSDDVRWNDMIDTELLRYVQVPQIENLLIKHEDNTLFDSNYKSVKLAENSAHETLLSKKVNITNRKPYEPNQLKSNDMNIKKPKKTVDPKTNFKKEKYTKTVKNWLKGVDSNCVDQMINPKINNQTSLQNLETKVSDVRVISKKKMVQARLTNNDGVMKYGKPKTITNINTSVEDETITNINTSVEDDTITNINTSVEDDTITNINTKRLKDALKNKNKFMVPIKPQIPVKDITYDIVTLDESNFDNYGEFFSHNNKFEVLVVLVFRNGSCQLNSHYTEDAPIPEGLLLNINEQFFYINSVEENNKIIIHKILDRRTIVCYDGKMLIILLSKILNCRPGSIIDLKVGGALIEPDNNPENFTDLQKLISYVPQYTIVAECTLQKAAWYMVLLKECMIKLKEILLDKCLWNIFVDVEMRLLPIIADMEIRGVSIDLEKLKSMEQVLSRKMKSVEEQCYASAGRTFQINSPLQVRALLYDQLRLDVDNHVTVKETLTTGVKSTSEAALRSLMPLHPLPRLILEYRHLHKAYSTFLAGISQHVKDGVVYPTWVQIAAATGRIACSNPNLQAIPKAPFNLVMFPEPNDEDGGDPLWFRSVYAARGGRRLLAADFRQVECRIFAFVAADESLLALLHRDEDIFRALAAQWLQKDLADVCSAERERTKRVVYASLYGAGARKLADMLALPYDQTLAVLASFNRTFPSLKSFDERVISECSRSGGVVRSRGGRARLLPDVVSRDDGRRAHAQRQARNYVVQGSAADLCKTAMILVEERLLAASPPVDAHLILQIHDELVWEVAEDDLDRAAVIIKEAMESSGYSCGLPLRLPVALSVGHCWAHMDTLNI